MEYLNHALFGIFPYIALSVFFLGCLLRFDREQYTWRSGSSQLLDRRNMVLASNLFHVGILGLFLGHFVGLLTPIEVFEHLGIHPQTKQMLAIVAGSIFGIITFVGLVLLVIRRLTIARIYETSANMDIAILLLLLAQLTIGLISIVFSLDHLEGATMVLFMKWAGGIIFFRPDAAEYLLTVSWVYKIHIVLGFTIALLFPFGRLVHIWSMPVWYFGRSYQVVRKRQQRSMVR